MCHISSFPQLSLNLHILGLFPPMFTQAVLSPRMQSWFIAFTFSFGLMLTYEWWWDLRFSNKNDLRHSCLINAAFYAFWRLWHDHFLICKIHTVQEYRLAPLTRVLPKGCNCHSLCCEGLRFQHGACVAITLTVMWYVRNEARCKQVALCCICLTIWYDIDLGN